MSDDSANTTRGGICAYSFIYFYFEFERIAIYAQGSFTQQDFIVGLLMFLLVMELSRLAHPVLFWTNVVLVVYTLWGYLSPIDFFWHPGTTFYRVVTSSTVEFSTGIYGLYGQLALTLIAAFLLLAGVANGFEAQRAMINVVRLIAGRSRQLIPQTAVVGSSAIGMISGSGSANAAVVGTITIPLMMRYGVPGTFAAAVETSASMGGLIMPPMMGVGAFLMSEFLGVPYWDVVLRGFALAFVYYVSIGVAVYLLCVRLLPRDAIEKPQVPLYDKVKTAIFFSSVLYLLYLMGFVGKGELLAALYTATFMFVLLVAAFLYFKYVARTRRSQNETLFGNIRRAIETHAEMTSYLTLLLATLGIMIGLFTVTGFINRMGAMLLDLGAWNIIAMIVHGLDFRLARRRGPAADRDLHHRRGGDRAADAGARHQPVDRAFLRVPAVGLGRAVAADLAHRRGLGAHRQCVVPQDHVRGAEDLRADHADDVRDLHPLQHGGESRAGCRSPTPCWCWSARSASPSRCSGAAMRTRRSTSRCAASWRRSRSLTMFHPDMKMSAAVCRGGGGGAGRRHLAAPPDRAAEELRARTPDQVAPVRRSRTGAGRSQARHRLTWPQDIP